ncbi:MAG: hypothetical protein WCK05_00805, partial [Planctomycetota bacterium]
TQLDGISKKIQSQNDYLDRTEARLRAKYARMETMLAQLGSQGASYQGLFDSIAQTTNKKD